MTSINDIQTQGVTYIWKDDERQTQHWGVIAVASKEVLQVLGNKLEAEDPEWEDFDNGILYYLDSSDGETIESMKNFDAPYEFLVVEGKD
jgi:hypothetical protein